MTKSVQKVATEEATAPEAQNSQNQQPRNLYVSVKTFDGKDGKTIGERVVDMYHFGTHGWFGKHLWWATHNGHEVEVSTASDEEVISYVKEATVALAMKFNAEPTAASLAA